MTKGIETLARMEEVETVKEGIFVMPKARVQIHSTYVTGLEVAGAHVESRCFQELQDLQQRFTAQSKRVEELRSSRLP